MTAIMLRTGFVIQHEQTKWVQIPL